MNWSRQEALDYEARQLAKRLKGSATSGAEELESPLHESIIAYCNSQWPRWKFIRCRMDKKSTIEQGAHDFTIFLPGARLLCVECKSKTGKVSTEQYGWMAEMAKLGHVVHVVRSFDDFLTIVDHINKPKI